jgi:hypothetical protein
VIEKVENTGGIAEPVKLLVTVADEMTTFVIFEVKSLTTLSA